MAILTLANTFTLEKNMRTGTECILQTDRHKKTSRQATEGSVYSFNHILCVYIAALHASINFCALAFDASKTAAFSSTSRAAANSFLALATSAA